MINLFELKPEDYSGVKLKEAFTVMPELKLKYIRGEISLLEVRVLYKAIKKEFFRQKGLKYDE